MQVVGIQPFVRTSHFPHIRARRKGRAQILACFGEVEQKTQTGKVQDT